MAGRHKGDTVGYRDLSNYKERVQSFNMAANKLREYVRVQLELDTTSSRSASEIIESRVETLQKAIEDIRDME